MLIVPVGIGHTMDLKQVDIVGLKFAQESFGRELGGEHVGAGLRPDGRELRNQLPALPGRVFQGPGNVPVRAIVVGRIEKSDTP